MVFSPRGVNNHFRMYALHTISFELHYMLLLFLCIYIYIFFFANIYFPASGQAVVTGVVPSSPRFLPSIFIALRVQQSHCSSIFHRVLLTHAVAFCASQFVRQKKSHEFIRVCTWRDSNPRNWQIPGSRTTWYATGATGLYTICWLVLLSSRTRYVSVSLALPW